MKNTKNAIALNAIKKIAFIGMHLEDYLQLMVVLGCART